MVTDSHIANAAGAGDVYMVAYAAPVGRNVFDVTGNEVFQPFRQGRGVAVEGEDVGKVGGEFVEDGNFPASCFVQDGNQCPIAESTVPVCDNPVRVLDEAAVADVVIGNVAGNVFDESVVADGAIMQGDTVQPGM